MFNALFRRPRPVARAATWFTPRLEALDGRIAPGGAYGGVLGDVRLAGASQVSVSLMHIGEEIPQTGAGAHAGHVECFGAASGGVL